VSVKRKELCSTNGILKYKNLKREKKLFFPDNVILTWQFSTFNTCVRCRALSHLKTHALMGFTFHR